MAPAGPSTVSTMILLLVVGTPPARTRPVLDLARTSVAYGVAEGNDGSETLSLTMWDSTRLTAPCRTLPDRWCVDDIPSERLSVPALLLDLRESVGRNRSSEVSREAVEEALLKANRGLKEKDKATAWKILLLWTGYKDSWTELAHPVTSGDAADSGSPTLSAETAQWLAENLTGHVTAVGLGTDLPYLGDSEVYRPLASRNLYVLESLHNLESLMAAVGGRQDGNSLLVALPLKLRGAKVAPARVLLVPAPPPEVDSRATPSTPRQQVAVVVLTLLTSLSGYKSSFCP